MTAGVCEPVVATGGPKALSAAFAGTHAWCNEKMVLSDELSDGMALPDFFASGAFDRALDVYTEKSGASDRRAVASMWSLYYFSSLTIPYLVARVLDHQVLPVAFDEMKMALAEDGLPGPSASRHLAIGKRLTTPTFSPPLAPDARAFARGGRLSQVCRRHRPETRLEQCARLYRLCAARFRNRAAERPGRRVDRQQVDARRFAQSLLRLPAPRGGRRRPRLPPQDLLPALPAARVPSCGSLCALPSQRNQ